MPGQYSRVKVWSSGEILTAADLNAEFNNEINNAIPASIDDYSANVSQRQETADPGETGSENLAVTLADELKQIRYVLREIKGTTNWNESAPSDIASLANPTGGLYLGLEFDGRYGGASTTTDVLAKLINQGAIINAASYTTADVAIADFDATNKKFGSHAYSIAAGNILAFPANRGNPLKGTFSAWYRNLASGDYIAYNPLLGIEIYLESVAGKQTFKITEKIAATETTKNALTVQGSATRSGVTTFANVTAKWRLNDEGGTSTDLMEMERNGVDEGTQLATQDIDITQSTGGVWFLGAKRQDPAWDHFSAFSVLPDAEAVDAWTAGGTTTGNVVSNGILTLDSTGAGATASDSYSKTNNIDLSQFTLEFKMAVTTSDRAQIVTDQRCHVLVRDDSLDRTIQLNIHKHSVVLVFRETTLSNSNHAYEAHIDTTQSHVYRITSSGSPNPTVNLYIDGVLVFSDDNAVADTTAADLIRFGDVDANSGRNSLSLWEWFAYFDAGAIAPVAAGTQGQLDSIGVLSTVVSDSVLSSIQSNAVTMIFGDDVTHGPYLPPTMSTKRHGELTTTSTTFTNITEELNYFVAGDGVSEFSFYFSAGVRSSGTSTIYMTMGVDDDAVGDDTALDEFVYYGGSRHLGGAGLVHTDSQSRSVVLPVGLHKISPLWAISSGTATASMYTMIFERILSDFKKL